MKLLNKTNEYYIAVAIAILFIGSFVISNRIFYLLNNDINENLIGERAEVEAQIARQPEIALYGISIGRIEITPIDNFHSFAVQLKDTFRFDPYADKNVKFRQLSYEKLINNRA